MIRKSTLHEHLQSSEHGKMYVNKFINDLYDNLFKSLSCYTIDKKSEELIDEEKIALAIIAGCEIEFECHMIEDGQYQYSIITKNKIAIQKNNGRFEVIESR